MTDDEVIIQALDVAIADANNWGEFGSDPDLLERYAAIRECFKSANRLDPQEVDRQLPAVVLERLRD